jgi:hypothetical protein
VPAVASPCKRLCYDSSCTAIRECGPALAGAKASISPCGKDKSMRAAVAGTRSCPGWDQVRGVEEVGATRPGHRDGGVRCDRRGVRSATGDLRLGVLVAFESIHSQRRSGLLQRPRGTSVPSGTFASTECYRAAPSCDCAGCRAVPRWRCQRRLARLPTNRTATERSICREGQEVIRGKPIRRQACRSGIMSRSCRCWWSAPHD